MKEGSEVKSKSAHKNADHISLCSCPFTTIHYFLRELLFLIYKSYLWLISHVKSTIFVSLLVLVVAILSHLEGLHQEYFELAQAKIFWCAYWIGLGILSSVGLGTGLHTFILYLGPHIASVTLAAYECSTLNFLEPPYPERIVCPDDGESMYVTIWAIMSKVRLEAFMWGAGTALGELPPYFMARAARLSGQELEDSDDEDDTPVDGSKKKWYLNAKESVKTLVERVGFFGILACASIPNPLFDLAGITCGHFLVPFWTFFGATLIGKAIIKMHIQKLFVIVAFNEHHFEGFVEKIRLIPYFGKYLQEPFRDFLNKQKASLHGKAVQGVQQASWISWVFEKFVVAMITYFVISIINSMAKDYYKRAVLVTDHSNGVKKPADQAKKPKKKVALD